MRGHHRGIGLALLASVALAACGRPAEPLEIGVREVRNDIVLGAQLGGDAGAPAPPPVPPTAVVIDLPSALPPAQPRFAPGPTEQDAHPALPSPAPPVCPQDPPLAAPRLAASRISATPPVAQTLTFRNDGRFSVSGANANEGTFGGETSRVVDGIERDPGGNFRYAVTAELGGTTTTTGYEVVVEPVDDTLGPVLDQQGVRDGRGLYVLGVRTRSPSGEVTEFRPATPMLLLPLPNAPGDTFQVQAVDPVAGVTMSYRGTVGEYQRVNACGTPLQAIAVELTEGRILGPGVDVEFTAAYAIATQFGAISVEDRFTTAGTEAGETSSRSNHAVINHVPRTSAEAS